MRFWDSSAIVPLLVHEGTSAAVLAELKRDPDMVVWWATEVECVSALARLEAEGRVSSASIRPAFERLTALASAWREVQAVPAVRRIAMRLLRTHPLRAADAMQLAAAIVAAEDEPATLPMVTFDERLARAAELEGFPVVRPAYAG